MKKSRKTLLIVLILVLLIAAMVAAWFYFGPNGVAGKKSITVEVTHLDGTTNTFEVKTDEEFLRPALEAEKLVSGTESEYGLFIDTVDGEYADPEKSEWWVFTVNGEMASYGVDQQPVEDKDVYAFSVSVFE